MLTLWVPVTEPSPALIPHVLTGLQPGVSYTFFVRAVCGANDTSQWSTRSASFVTPVVCPPPTAIIKSNITANSVDISWTSTGGNELLEYGPVGYTPGTGATAGAGGTLISSATPPLTISGLNAASGYDVFIRQNCSGASNGYSANLSTNVATTGAPANNNYCGAATLVVNSPVVSYVNTTNATTSAADPSITSCSVPNNNVWYKFTTGAAGIYYVNAFASKVNTGTTAGNMSAWLYLYTAAGTCPGVLTFTSIADLGDCASTVTQSPAPANNNVPPNVSLSTVTPALTAATTYYIFADGNNGSMGNIGFTISTTPLAIKLGKLTAINVGSANRLEWNTLSEAASDKFELQRSADGKTFEGIANDACQR